MARRQSQSDSALWFFAGAALGATIALLYAPQPGHETRRQIKGAALKGADRVAESGQQIAELGRELVERGKALSSEAAEMFERGRKLIDDPEFGEEEA
jgi:gas vesicle protein